MTQAAPTEDAIGTRRATIESEVASPATVAAAIAPDDTDQLDTRVEDGRVVTTIERPTTGGLEATIDDYVVALDVAIETVAAAQGGQSTDRADGSDTRALDDDTPRDEQDSDRHDTDTP